MKLFVTGATGFIGGALTGKLLGDGHEVHALTRDQDSHSRLRHQRLIWHNGDLFDLRSLSEAMEGCDMVFHLAAYARVWHREPKFYTQMNVAGTINAVECALRNRVRKFIFTSTAGIVSNPYGQRVTENDVTHCDLSNQYVKSKIEAESKLRNYLDKDIEMITVNPARVYGPGKLTRSNSITQMILKAGRSRMIFLPMNGEAIGSYCYVEDITKGHWQAATLGRSGERYLLGGHNVSYNEFGNILNEVLGKNCRIIRIPKLMIRAGAMVELLRGILTGHEPLIIPSWINKYSRNQIIDSSKAVRELGYTITPLQQGINNTIEWYNSTIHS